MGLCLRTRTKTPEKSLIVATVGKQSKTSPGMEVCSMMLNLCLLTLTCACISSFFSLTWSFFFFLTLMQGGYIYCSGIFKLWLDDTVSLKVWWMSSANTSRPSKRRCRGHPSPVLDVLHCYVLNWRDWPCTTFQVNGYM